MRNCIVTGGSVPPLPRVTQGLGLLDAIVAAVVLGLAGGALLDLLSTTTRRSFLLEDRVLIRQLAMDILERHAAGDARTMLADAPQGGEFEYCRTLTDDQWRQAVSPEQVQALSTLAPRITLFLVADPPTPRSPEIRSGWVRCHVAWRDRAGHDDVFDVATFSDALTP